MNLPLGAVLGTTIVGSAPAVPAGEASEAGSGEAVVATGCVVLVTGVVEELDDDELEQALSPREATSTPAAIRDECFFMVVPLDPAQPMRPRSLTASRSSMSSLSVVAMRALAKSSCSTPSASSARWKA